MKAGDVMTPQVITVPPHAPARVVAKILSEGRISAAPVVDAVGDVIGMVSEGDLMPRDEAGRDERRAWWLYMLAEGEPLGTEFERFLAQDQRAARDLMSAPVVTVAIDADLVEVAAVLATHGIKRVPVLADGRMVGIVSRADIVRALAQDGRTAASPPPTGHAPASLQAVAERLHALQAKLHPATSKTPMTTDSHATGSTEPTASPDATTPETVFSAASFRGLVARHDDEEITHRVEAHQRAHDKRHHQTEEMLAADLTDAAWRRMIHEAQIAAGHGESEHMLIRFPCDVCSDHGRAVNAPDPDWPATLRGLPAQLYLRWKEELRPRGFGLTARVVDFPDGLPGDVGLFLSWGS